MSKPLGIGMSLTGTGSLSVDVIHPSAVEDEIWDAVREAQRHGWSVERFRSECQEAWANELRERAKADDAAWEPKP